MHKYSSRRTTARCADRRPIGCRHREGPFDNRAPTPMRDIGLHAAGCRCHTELGDLGTAIHMTRTAPYSLCGAIIPSRPGWLRKPRRRTGAAHPPRRSGRPRSATWSARYSPVSDGESALDQP
jgi:hypothetical protein